MDNYVCTVCGYVYESEKGDPDAGIEPGTNLRTCLTTGHARSAGQVRKILKRRIEQWN